MADVINPNWSRWIFASLADHFASNSGATPFFVEGQNRSTTITDFAELRMDGPYFDEINDHYWKIDVLVAVIINIVQNDVDIHKLERIIGTFLAAFTTEIPIYRYGNQIVDDQSLLSCLQLSTNTGERIRVDKFGQVKSATRVAQASIEARYLMSLDTGQ